MLRPDRGEIPGVDENVHGIFSLAVEVVKEILQPRVHCSPKKYLV
jgi:hypothetical protein